MKKLEQYEFDIINWEYEDVCVKLAVINNFDELLNHYVDSTPDNTDMIPYYADLWPSAKALAKVLVENKHFVCGKRVLELGAGLALPSILSAKLCASEVIASDYHPDNSLQIIRNAELNSVNVKCLQLDWRFPPENEEKFDVILGSDLLYEHKSVNILVSCVKQMLKPDGLFILADPGRDYIQEAADKFEEAGLQLELSVVDNILILDNRH